MDDCVVCGHGISSDEHFKNASACYMVLQNSLVHIANSQELLHKLGLEIQIVSKSYDATEHE